MGYNYLGFIFSQTVLQIFQCLVSDKNKSAQIPKTDFTDISCFTTEITGRDAGQRLVRALHRPVRPRVVKVSPFIRLMIVTVAPAGLTEWQRGGVGGAAAGEIATCITVPAIAASAGPGVAAPQVIPDTDGPLPTLTDSAVLYADVATSPVIKPTAVIRPDWGGPGQQQQPHPAPPGAEPGGRSQQSQRSLLSISYNL